ncbi:MAG: M28 family peptidase [Acidobacteria bacterium]|nr:M28 family peptidase [Acidobacteriota bacterium]
MLRRRIILCLLVTAFCAAADQPMHFDGSAWWHYVSVLADDNMEGRQTGSPGLKRAQAFVVDQLKAAGLQPAGSSGFYQPVKFIERSINEAHSSLALVRSGKPEPLALGDDAYFSTRVDLAASVEAPLAFVGYGLSIPEKGYDDLAGQDLKGKVVVTLAGQPAEIPGALASHASSAGERWRALKAAGAIGVISIPNPANMDIPWPRMSLSRTQPSMTLADPEFDETVGEKLAITFNPEHAGKLFMGSGHTFDELLSLAKEKKPLPHFVLPVSVRARAELLKRPLECANLVARITGADPQLKNEYVVVTAHLDHLGIGEPINGDRIYNGAMDNASGSAALLDIAQSIAKSQDRPRRSMLFVWVTAEEKGLLGSRYFAAHPTVPKSSIAANVNMDMFLPIIPLKVLTVLGLDESDLGDWAREVAGRQGVPVQPDPEPQRNTFIRSDQYSFIRQGIPALHMKVGFEGADREIQQAWLHQRYHAPSDDLNQPVDKATAAKYEEIVRALALKIADHDARPEWKPGSFFRRFEQLAK